MQEERDPLELDTVTVYTQNYLREQHIEVREDYAFLAEQLRVDRYIFCMWVSTVRQLGKYLGLMTPRAVSFCVAEGEDAEAIRAAVFAADGASVH